ncbi:hypothetical protein JCM17845_04720 [Iodidimonas gelatinilytica]|uniref:Uncharacterized protein n=1 Tax=Iodidimonas gelatinilytica TaxID=1236966 RepID=A0A5A7MXW8_9PROT|nr:hypothetical protein [Iodidimonas gelatinilytica]GEQ99848.1 hypothetical protein JCM17845_04720 [Iodidimonas gelatinilytica]
MTNQLADILSDPHWFLHSVSKDLSSFTFLRLERDQLTAPAFLDATLQKQAADQCHIPTSAVAQYGAGQALPPYYIFHSAFCCSTLLARCMDLSGAFLALKEPNA